MLIVACSARSAGHRQANAQS